MNRWDAVGWHGDSEPGQRWCCAQCGEVHDGAFDRCWQCGEARR